MAADSSNPFASLDKSRFRKADDAEGSSAKDRRKQPKVKMAQGTAEPSSPEDEAALFLNAMGSVRSLNTEAVAEPEPEIFDPDNLLEKKSAQPGLNRLNLPKKMKKGRAEPISPDDKTVTGDTANSSQTGDNTLNAEFAKLVGLTLPKAHDDKSPALFRELQQGGKERREQARDRDFPLERREQARDRSRTAVASAKEKEHDAQLARLADPEADTEALFMDAMGAVAPLSGKGREVMPAVPAPDMPITLDDNPMQDFMDGKLAFTLASTDEYVEGHVVGLDLMLVSKLQNGQFSPEGHLDLHGLNAVQAFHALVGFMRGAYMKGHRTVLVVPGRGKNSPMGLCVLREKLQEWFTQEPFRRVILAFCTAKSSDGGAGAMYVLLRKYKKTNGKVYWDKTPVDPDLLL